MRAGGVIRAKSSRSPTIRDSRMASPSSWAANRGTTEGSSVAARRIVSAAATALVPVVVFVWGLESRRRTLYRLGALFAVLSLAAAWRRRGLAVEVMDMAGHDHFSIISELGDPGAPLSRAILHQIDPPGMGRRPVAR